MRLNNSHRQSKNRNGAQSTARSCLREEEEEEECVDNRRELRREEDRVAPVHLCVCVCVCIDIVCVSVLSWRETLCEERERGRRS